MEELQPCDLFTIELAFDDHHQIPPGDRVYRIKGSLPANLMWQKERLLNILMENIPDDYRHIAWCDGDIVFKRPDRVGAP